jgi:GTPase SAR1 family protein
MKTFEPENINIVLVGTVSSGKSTITNGVIGNIVTETKRATATMLPSRFRETDDPKKVHPPEQIYAIIKEGNEKVQKMRESGTYKLSDLIQPEFNVNKIQDFVTMPDDKTTISIIDVPGLNCSGDDLYYTYLKQSSEKFDIYIVVLDMTTSIGTTDQINIMKTINELIKKNKYGYVHVLLNKCDTIVNYTSATDFKFKDDSDVSFYADSVKTIKTHLCDCKHVTIAPFSAKTLLFYRLAKYNIQALGESYLDEFIRHFISAREFNAISGDIGKKQAVATEIVKNSKSPEIMEYIINTGYPAFQHSMQKHLEHYPDIITKHIMNDIELILEQSTIDFEDPLNIEESIVDELFNKIREFFYRLNNLVEKSGITNVPSDPIDEIVKILNIVNDSMKAGIITCIGKDIKTADKYIEKLNDFISEIGEMFKKNPLSETYNILIERRIQLLITKLIIEGYDEQIFNELLAKKKMTFEIYTKCIETTIENTTMSVDNLLNSVNKSTGTNITFLKAITEIYIRNYKYTEINVFCNILKTVTNIFGKNPELILELIKCMIKHIEDCPNILQIYLIGITKILMHKISIDAQYICQIMHIILTNKMGKYHNVESFISLQQFAEEYKNIQEFFKFLENY